MEIKQKFNTFVRDFNDCVYIYNSETKDDLFVDKNGGLFLSQITREWKSLDLIVDELLKIFENVSKEEISCDAIEFYNYLNKKGFVDLNEARTKDNISGIIINQERNTDIKYLPIVNKVPDATQERLLKMVLQHPRLLSLQIELTNLCNERCVHCYIPHKYKTKKLSWELYENILEEANRMGVLTIVINGGEPMSHPDFLKMLRKATTYDFDIRILSNLTQLTDEIIECIKSSHVSEVQTSVYSIDATVHDEITKVSGSLNITLKNVLKLKSIGVPIRIACVLMKQNKNCYKDVIQWCKEQNVPLSIDYILFGRYDYSTDNLSCRLSKEEIEQIISDTIEKDESYVRNLKSTDFQQLDNYYKQFGVSCNVGRSTICISSDGIAYPCIGWQGYKLGNISELSLEEIWNGPELERLRNLSMHCFGECKECEDKFFCSRCLVRNANENQGDFMKLNKQTCELAHLNRVICEKYFNEDYRSK